MRTIVIGVMVFLICGWGAVGAGAAPALGRQAPPAAELERVGGVRGEYGQRHCYRRYFPSEFDQYFKHRLFRVPRDYRQEFGLYYHYFDSPEYRRHFRDFRDEHRYLKRRPPHPWDQRGIRLHPGYRLFLKID